MHVHEREPLVCGLARLTVGAFCLFCSVIDRTIPVKGVDHFEEVFG